MDIFISESYIGMHRPACDTLNVKFMAFTFPTSFVSISRPIKNVVLDTKIPVTEKSFLYIEGKNMEDSLKYCESEEYNGDIIALIVSLKEEWNATNIFLGQDLDHKGQLMASLLYYYLIEAGIDSNNIFRVPLIETGYDYTNIGFGEFYSREQLRAILELSRIEEHMRLVYPRTRMGYRKMFTLAHIEKYRRDKRYKVKRQTKGVSTATYLTKSALVEKSKE